MLARQCAVKFGGGAGNGFGQVAEVGLLRLAEVERVVQFLQHHELCALLCGLCDGGCQAGLVGLDVGGAALLYECGFHEERVTEFG